MKHKNGYFEYIPLLFLHVFNLLSYTYYANMKWFQNASIIILTAAGYFFLIKVIGSIRFSQREIIIVTLLFGIVAVNWYITKENMMIKAFFFFLAIKNLTWNKLLKCFLLTNIIFAAFMCFSTNLGIIEVGYSSNRYNAGFFNPNTAALFFMSFFVLANCLVERRKFLFYICEIIGAYSIWKYTGSRSFLICVSLLIILTLINDYLLNLLTRIKKNRVLRNLFIYSFPLFTIFSYMLSKLYLMYPFLRKINGVLSGRFRLWSIYINHVPFSWFGIKSAGYEGSLDNAYIATMLWFGLTGILLYTIIFVLAAKEILKYENSKLMIIYIVFIAYMFTEVGPISANYNVVLWYAFSQFWMNKKSRSFIEKLTFKKLNYQ